MLLKRILTLAAGVLLCIAAFVVYLEYSQAQMEGRFNAERQKYHVDRLALSAAAAAPAVNRPAIPTPASGDTNALIGPVPPAETAPAPGTPDAPAPPAATGDSNAAPAAPSSTFHAPHSGASPFQFASFTPGATSPFHHALVLGATNDLRETTAAPAAVESSPAPVEAAPARPGGEASVIVLLYHQFVPAGVHIAPKLQWTMNVDVFESEMKYIHDNGYHVVPMSDVIKFIKHEITLPPGSVCITIDDGYKSAIVHAAPILKKYGYPWTFFIYPAFITVNEGSGAASWNDLLRLQAEGIDIESHSMTHPQLTHKGSKTPEQYAAWLKNETAGSKALLESKMGKPITAFAYPFGAYNKQVEQAAIDAGYESIFTVADNPVHSTTNLHSIGRYTITQAVEKNFPAYLRQSALSLTKTDPEPGATVTNPRPVITAVLSHLGSDALDPASLETSVRDFGLVRHDFDPQTNTVRLYLPRDLITPVALVNIRVRDAKTGQVMVANWHFNYEPSGGAVSHAPIAAPAAQPTPPVVEPAPAAAPSASAPVPGEPQAKDAAGTPLESKLPPSLPTTKPSTPNSD